MKTTTSSRTTGFVNARLKPSPGWVWHFRRELQRDWSIPWDATATLTPEEQERIAASIAEFQRGESSEARQYLGRSARFAEETGDPAFHVTSHLFIQAENLHAGLLLRFMTANGIPRRESTWADGIFRLLRHAGDLGWASRVLISAELIAQEYYPALRDATTHPVLRRICQRVIADEAGHIRFQVERIARLEAGCSKTSLWLRDRLHIVLLAGTALVVWYGHRPVLAVHGGRGEFWRRLLARYRRALATMRVIRERIGAQRAPLLVGHPST